MRKPKAENLSSTLFRKTGLLFASLAGLYLVIFTTVKLFRNSFPETFNISVPVLVTIGICAVLFTLSALYAQLAWIQPIILLIMTPFPMVHHISSMFSLGTFIAAEILLFRLGFFERSKLVKFLLSIAYFYLCGVLMGITSGTSILEIAMPILFMTIFLAFLMLVYGDKWIIYLAVPKPPLSLAALKITRKESKYLRALLDGTMIKEIAINDGVKESTVRNTLARVYRKFDVTDKSALMAKCENYSITE
jgi:DNA-binding CsgD family transcriptional regulator